MAAIALDDAFELELEVELQLVRDAVLLVASGGARRVVVANLRHGRVLLGPARAFAVECGLELLTLAAPDATRLDFSIRPSVGRPDSEVIRELR